MMKDELAVLVVSCDKYSDLWDYFFSLKNIYWHDCDIPFYIGSNTVRYSSSDIVNISIGKDASWTENVKKMLSSIQEKYVIILLEDFFFQDFVDNNKIHELAHIVEEKKLDCLRLCPDPPATRIVDKENGLGPIGIHAPYRICTQPSIWSKEYLKKILIDGYSAWDFEKKNSSDPNRKDDAIWGTRKKYINIHNGVERGKYYTSTIQLIKRNGLEFKTQREGIINDQTMRFKLYKKLYTAIKYVRSYLNLV